MRQVINDFQNNNMTKEELINLVTKIMDPDNPASEEEIDSLIETLENNVPDPNVTDLIYWANNSPTQVVEKALSYKIVALPPHDSEAE